MKTLNTLFTAAILSLGLNANAILPGPDVKIAPVKSAQMDQSLNLGTIESGQIEINLTDKNVVLTLVNQAGEVNDKIFQIVEVKTNLCGAQEYHAVSVSRGVVEESLVVFDFSNEVCKIKRSAKTVAAYETYQLNGNEEVTTHSKIFGDQLTQVVY